MSLRMIEVVTSSSLAAVLKSVDEKLEILGAWSEPLEEELHLLRVLVRGEKTEAVIHSLSSRLEGQPDFRLMIFEVEAVLPEPPDPEPEEKPEDAEEKSSNDSIKNQHRIACAELVQKLSSGNVVNRIFVLTVVLSTVVAVIGLLRGDVAVIIGAMVIAPLLGPNMTLSLATTLGDGKLMRQAVWVNGAGVALALAISAVAGLVVSVDASNPEIQNRLIVGLSDVVLALAAGSAGALAFTTGLSSALVGVMVAVALLPPLATSGLLLGSGQWNLALSSLLLTTTNIICINVAGVATFLFQNVRPAHWWEAERAKKVVRAAALIWLVLLGVWVFLIFLAS